MEGKQAHRQHLHPLTICGYGFTNAIQIHTSMGLLVRSAIQHLHNLTVTIVVSYVRVDYIYYTP